MKLLIASDLHGSYHYTKLLFELADRLCPDRILLLGDLLYHGPRNDLPEEYAPKRVIELLNERKSSLLCVRGNCDTEVDQMVLQFPLLADYALVSLEGADELLRIATDVITADEVEELKRIINSKYDKRIELYDKGFKQWDANVSVTMVVRGEK